MAGKSFRCEIVTPTNAFADDNVQYASVPAWDGLMGMMPGRAAIFGQLGVGELRVDIAEDGKGKGGSRSYVVDGGFFTMSSDKLTILAERVLPAEQVNAGEAEQELRSATENRAKDFARAKLAAARKKTGGI